MFILILNQLHVSLSIVTQLNASRHEPRVPTLYFRYMTHTNKNCCNTLRFTRNSILLFLVFMKVFPLYPLCLFSLFQFPIDSRSYIWVFPFLVSWFLATSLTIFQTKQYWNKIRKNWTCSETHKLKCSDLLQDQHTFHVEFPFLSITFLQKLIQYKRKRM